ncbi:MAG: hypothetical protein NUV98_00705 [Candidatus Roizmanbacteria bacterium]|nr:hypothetical protein [Candidatus Roizmanbacteria bacterium]
MFERLTPTPDDVTTAFIAFFRGLIEMDHPTMPPQEVRDLQEPGIFEIAETIRNDQLRLGFSSFTPHQTSLSELTR